MWLSFNTIHWNRKLYVQGDRITSSSKKVLMAVKSVLDGLTSMLREFLVHWWLDVLISFNAFVGVLISHIKSSKKYFKIRFSLICLLWCIWRKRNNRNFKDKECLLDELRRIQDNCYIFQWAQLHDFLVFIFSSWLVFSPVYVMCTCTTSIFISIGKISFTYKTKWNV